MKLLFAHDPWRAEGGAFGYATHAREIAKALVAAGVEITTDPADSFDLAVHITRPWPGYFDPIPGRRNLLWTQIELSEPQELCDLEKADVLITSSTHGQRILERYYKRPVELVYEGVDPLDFPYVKRTAPEPGKPFVFLWHNFIVPVCKGFDLVLQAWKLWEKRGRRPKHAMLFVKNSGIPGLGIERLPAANAYLDSRQLSAAELSELYAGAHAFVSASMGEGFGLTIAQALASGLPTIFTAWSAPTDYADSSVAFPVDDFELLDYGPGANGLPNAFGAKANPEAIMARMEEIHDNYMSALERGKLASERMRSFTWEASARKFIAICERALELPITPTAGDEVSARAPALP